MGIGLGSSVREKSVREKMQANETRFPLEQARQAIERYRKKNAAAG
jgi:hypothetical protein